MPKFTKMAIDEKQPKEIDPKILEKYKKFVEQIEKNERGILEFESSEKDEMKIARNALAEAGKLLNKYVKVRKSRGVDSQLEFYMITKKEFEEMEQKNIQRGQKISKSKGKK